MMTESPNYRRLAEVSQLAGACLMGYFRRDLTVTAKEDESLVSEADLASEKVILDWIHREFPGEQILSEENTKDIKRIVGEYVWVVDPLDGTTNFVNGYPFFCTSIARCRVADSTHLVPIQGAVYDPVRKDFFYAELGEGAYWNGERLRLSRNRLLKDSFLVTGFYYNKGEDLARDIERFHHVAQVCQSIRRDGSAALDLAYVACGIYDLFWESGLSAWDVAAGTLLVKEAGAEVESLDQEGFHVEGRSIICGTKDSLHELLTLLKG